MGVYTHTPTHPHIHTPPHTHTYPHTRTSTHPTHTHTHIHTPTHTHIHTPHTRTSTHPTYNRIYIWYVTGLLYTKISNHNIIYSSQKPRKSSLLPIKSSSWLFSLDASISSYKMSFYLPSAHKMQVEFR
jgi:hypothetical protein